MNSISGALSELDGLRRRLAGAESSTLGKGLDKSGQAAQFKAGCLVWIMALLERLMVDLAAELRDEVSKRCLSAEVIHNNLAMAMSQGAWQAASLQSRKGFLNRIDLIKTHAMETSDWTESFSFHDGKTVDDATFDAIWAVLDLPGQPFDAPAGRQVLRDLARRRNRVSHGEETVLEAGRAITFQDLSRSMDRIDEILTDMLLALDSWLDDAGWRA